MRRMRPEVKTPLVDERLRSYRIALDIGGASVRSGSPWGSIVPFMRVDGPAHEVPSADMEFLSLGRTRLGGARTFYPPATLLFWEIRRAGGKHSEVNRWDLARWMLPPDLAQRPTPPRVEEDERCHATEAAPRNP